MDNFSSFITTPTFSALIVSAKFKIIKSSAEYVATISALLHFLPKNFLF